MSMTDYQDILWDFVSVGAKDVTQRTGEDNFVLRLYSDEDDLYRDTSERNQQNEDLPVTLPFSELSSSRNSSTKWMRRRVTRDEAIAVGMKLWDALPLEAIQAITRKTADDLKVLRIKICSASQQITDLPWEWLSDGTEIPVALRSNIRLVRTVPIRFQTPPLTVQRPVKVLLVLTNPKDERLLNSFAELDAVSLRLKMPDFEMHLCQEPTLEALEEQLRDVNPTILHYIGHAGVSNGEGNIILHDHTSRTFWVSGSLLSQMLPPSVRLICLSTCFTANNYQLLGLPHFAYSTVEQQLPTMVTNQYPLDEQSIIVFWDKFYSSLIENQGDINEAVHVARRATANIDQAFADWASFALVLRDRTGRAIRIIDDGESKSALLQRQVAEYQAQYAARLANDLGEQVRIFGSDVSRGIREKFELEKNRASSLLDKLTE